MPYINKVRLVNVRFNNNTSQYEDLKMPFDGKSSTYELINGGGKSVLLMMLLQVVLPNEPLKVEKPVKNIFIDTKDITSHVLVEWILEDGGYYSHLLTGFCARKSRDKDSTQGTTDGGIDYYNYTFLYNNSNPNDIYNLELFKEVHGSKSVMSYHELKDKLNKLKDSGLPIEIFENKKGKYQEVLQQYQIINAEWDILRKINVRENNLANYFREDKSSRKLIENFLVRIVDKVRGNKDKISEEEFADVLIKMKDTFAKLQKEYELLNEYDQYDIALDRLIGSISKAIKVFEDVDVFNRNTASVVNALSSVLRENEELLVKKKETLELEKERLNDLERDMSNLDVIKEQLLLKKRKDEEALKNKEFLIQKNKLVQLEEEIQYLKGVNKCLDYREIEAKLNGKNEELKKIKMSDFELTSNRAKLGKQLKFLFDKKLNQLKEQKESIEREKSNTDLEVERFSESISELNKKMGSLESEVSRYTDEVVELKSQQNICNSELLQSGEFNTIIYDASIYIEQKSLEIEEIQQAIIKIEEETRELTEAKGTISVKRTQLEGEKNLLNEKIHGNEERLSVYQSLKYQVDSLGLDYEKDDVCTLKSELTNILNEEYSKKIELEISIKDINRQLKTIEQYDVYVFNHKLLELHDHLKKKFNVILGSEFLKSLSTDERKTMLVRYKLLPYSVMLPQTEYHKIQNDIAIIGKKFMDTMIPIVNWDAINGNRILNSNDIVFPTRDIDFHLKSLDDVDDFKTDLIKKKEAKKIELEESESAISIYQGYLGIIKRFLEEYPTSVVDKLFQEKSELSNSLRILQDEEKQIEEEEKVNEQRIYFLSGKFKDLESQDTRLKIIHEMLLQFKGLNESISKYERELKVGQSALDEVIKQLNVEKEKKKNYLNRLDNLRNLINENNRNIENLDEELSKLTEFEILEDIVIEDNDLEGIRERYRVYNERYTEEVSSVNRIHNEMKELKKRLNDLLGEIEIYGCSIDLILKDTTISRTSNQTIKDKQANKEGQENKVEKLRQIKDEAREVFVKQQELFLKCIKRNMVSSILLN